MNTRQEFFRRIDSILRERDAITKSTNFLRVTLEQWNRLSQLVSVRRSDIPKAYAYGLLDTNTQIVFWIGLEDWDRELENWQMICLEKPVIARNDEKTIS